MGFQKRSLDATLVMQILDQTIFAWECIDHLSFRQIRSSVSSCLHQITWHYGRVIIDDEEQAHEERMRYAKKQEEIHTKATVRGGGGGKPTFLFILQKVNFDVFSLRS